MTDSPAASPSLDAGATYRRDRSTWLFYATLCYYAYLISCLGPAMPFLRDELGFPLGVASWHFGAAAAGGVCVGLFGEPVIRLLGRERAHWLGAGGLGRVCKGMVALADDRTTRTERRPMGETGAVAAAPTASDGTAGARPPCHR